MMFPYLLKEESEDSIRVVPRKTLFVPSGMKGFFILYRLVNQEMRVLRKEKRS
ncbi:hypothetical protein Sgly_1628 [Syntrophobotulus glycolicus DSM 8271]|uniref:Uncharacterized protein n=1 Tax=Syntrophobotulus glycolicus (strain DSM 8271 / FlGlyR) TaxID=645991 RepID=F0SY91_SYNGF|nr:hypothetical protein Sgly_1628 [Syntrophobotulus glycolicus DSM 8271]